MSFTELFWKSDKPKPDKQIQTLQTTTEENVVNTKPEETIQLSEAVDVSNSAVIQKMCNEFDEIIKRDYPLCNKFFLTKKTMSSINSNITDQQVLDVISAGETTPFTINQLREMISAAQTKVLKSFDENVEIVSKKMEEDKSALGQIKVEIESLKQKIKELEETSQMHKSSIDSKFSILNNATNYKNGFLTILNGNR